MAEEPLAHRHVNQLKKVQGRDVRIEFHLCEPKDVEPSLPNTHIQKLEAHGKLNLFTFF